SSTQRLRCLYENKDARLLQLWQQISEMGLLVSRVDPEYGGLGLGMLAATQLANAAGRALLPLPLSIAMAAAPVLLANKERLSAEWQDNIQAIYFTGEQLLHLAMPWDKDHWRIDFANIPGPALWKDGSQLGLRALDSQTSYYGIDKSIATTMISQRDFVHTVALPVANDEATTRFEQTLRLMWIAELNGVAQSALDQALAYAKEREQFGKPIGANQAIKHRFADLWMALDNAQLAVDDAAMQFDKESEFAIQSGLDISQYVAMQAAKAITSYAIQVFGAMGVTWECDIHMYLKRCRYLCALLDKICPSNLLLKNLWSDEQVMGV